MSAPEKDGELVIQLLGSTSFRLGGEALVINPKEMALFVYLVLEGKPQSREHLAELFWPERSHEQSLKNLRVLLSRLRKSLDAYLIITRTTVAFNKESPHRIDLKELRKGLADKGETKEDGCLILDIRKRLERALELYHGPLLGDLQTNTSPAYEHWLELQRSEVQRQVIHARRYLIEDALNSGLYGQGLHHSQLLLAEDPWEERHHRYHMQLLARSGQEHKAREYFETCRTLLKEEMGREPEHETFQLLEQIESGDLSVKPTVVQRKTKLEDNLQILLDKVARFWIEEVHQDMLGEHGSLDLEKTVRPDLLNRSWATYLGVRDVPKSETVPAEETLGSLLKRLGPSLLLTGDTGAGKTFTLLSLLVEAIEWVNQDPTGFVPVVFHLGSWPPSHTDLRQWMTQELNVRYQIPRGIATQWIEDHRLFPLLDGLDEMQADGMAPCIRAINEYRLISGLNAIVVCTREAPYISQKERLHFDAALAIEPLDPAHVRTILNKHAHAESAQLLDLARTPLFLNIVQEMGISYRPEMVHTESELLSQQLPSIFVERLLQRRAARSPLPLERLKASLRWLASRSSKHHAVMFDPDALQPLWLTRLQRGLYLILSRMLCGLAIGVLLASFSLRLNGDPILYRMLPLVGLFTGLAMAGLDISVMSLVRLQQKWGWPLQILRFIVTAILCGSTAAFLHIMLIHPQNVRFTLVLFALLFALMFGSYSPEQLLTRDIGRADALSWSWRKGLKGGLASSIIAMLVAFALLKIIGLFFPGGHNPQNIFPVIGGSSLLFGCLFFGFRTLVIPPSLQKRGIWHNVGRGAWLGLLSFCCILPMFVLFRYVMSQLGLPVLVPNRLNLASPLILGLNAALMVGALVFYRCGAFVLIKHVILRAILHVFGCLPWNTTRFLTFVVQCGLLRRTGPCYLFAHRTFMESLAKQPPKATCRPHTETEMDIYTQNVGGVTPPTQING